MELIQAIAKMILRVIVTETVPPRSLIANHSLQEQEQ